MPCRRQKMQADCRPGSSSRRLSAAAGRLASEGSRHGAKSRTVEIRKTVRVELRTYVRVRVGLVGWLIYCAIISCVGVLAFGSSRKTFLLRVYNRWPSKRHELHQVLRENQIQRPIQSHSELFFDPRQLTQINHPPEPPGNKTGKFARKDLRHAGAVADGGQLADRCKNERLFGSAFERGGDILPEDPSLAERVLRRGRIGMARFEIRDRGAITERPDAGPAWYFEKLADRDPAAIFLAGQWL